MLGVKTAFFSGYDIIGDLHGCANTLVQLLEKLGYHYCAKGYFHPKRQAIFVGDLLDRGPHIREVINIVKPMVDAGFAQCLMGNHEYNVLGYHLWLDDQQRYLRNRTPHNTYLIQATLDQYAQHPEEWQALLKWLQQRPLFLELPGFRVVHACWDNQLISTYKNTYHRNTVDEAFMRQSGVRGSFAYVFMNRLTQGTDLPLPAGVKLLGRDGVSRSHFRTKFWAIAPETYQDVIFQPDPLPDYLTHTPLNDQEKSTLLQYPSHLPPVFMGHYWLQGRPRVLASNIACLDYSAVKYGRLVAYRFDGEHQLNNDKFVWVHVDPAVDA